MKSRKSAAVIFSFLFLFVFILEKNYAIANTSVEGAAYICELGVTFYKAGRFDEALLEFDKALMLDPGNKIAKKYVNDIFKRESTPFSKPEPRIKLKPQAKPKAKPEVKPKAQVKPKVEPQAKLKPQPKPELKRESKPIEPKPSREEMMDSALSGSSKSKPESSDDIVMKGEALVSLGVTPDDVIGNQALFDLNEENYRILSNNAYNRRTNTYDTRIYDKLKFTLNDENEEGFGFYSNIVVDPWSYTGKSDKITVRGANVNADTAELELLAWGNSKYTVNHTVYTDLRGDSFSLPETKIVNGELPATTITSTSNNIFTIPESEIEYQFQPLRELFFDYKQENSKVRFFPIAYQDQALTSDDPLVLSNNHKYWQQSPWLDSWLPGHLNAGLVTQDFQKGKFDDSLSYYTRDSEGTRLTALRGLAFEFAPDEDVFLSSTFATPKDLWQDYDSFDNVINATRLKYRLLDNLSLGSLYTYRLGLNNNKKDFSNYLFGADIGFEPKQGVKLTLEAATSVSDKDLTSESYKTESRGNAYHFSLAGTNLDESLMDLKYGYNEIKQEENSSGFFVKYRLYLGHMDEGFNASLSNYRETRDDVFWSRHIHFRQPLAYFYSGLETPGLSWDDIEPSRIGNGIDIGRDALGFRLETAALENKLSNLFDVRNVHQANGKFIENVVRDEVTYKATDKLTTKLLGIDHRLPKTKGGVDPFVFDAKTDIYLNNQAIIDGQDPSLKTGSLGLEYAFTEWMALSGIWEHTNDYTLAYDNFPRGNLNSTSFTTFSEYDKIYRREDPFLYTQGLFPLPPYPYYNIWKTGLRLDPMDELEIYLDYTRNEFKSAGQIDDNMNHIGIQVSYLPTKKLGVLFGYTYSRWNDVNRMLSGYDKIYLGHHNFSTELRYLPGHDDEFILQYGESGKTLLATTSFDPFAGSLPTLDTRHIFRLYYRRKF